MNDINKNITNNITYIINKKMNEYNDKINDKLDSILIKIDNNNLNNNLNKNIEKIFEEISFLKNKLENIENTLNSISINKSDYLQNTLEIQNSKNKISIIENNNILVKNKEFCSKDNLFSKDNNSILENDKNNILFYKELKKEDIILDDTFVKECLNMSNIKGDIKIFRKIYIDNIPKEYYPIRHIKKKYQYWYDGHMVDDETNGNYIKNTILKNIEECYLRINTYDNYLNDMEQFLKNQEHINKLSEQKYKDLFLKKIIEIISI
jgi:hypothetical protein